MKTLKNFLDKYYINLYKTEKDFVKLLEKKSKKIIDHILMHLP